MEIDTIYNGDCLEILPLMNEKSIDIVVTSPPYNKMEGKNAGKIVDAVIYDSFRDNMSESEYEENQINVLQELHRVLKDDGSVFYNHKNRYFNERMVSPLEWLLQTDFEIRQEIIWNRKIAGNIRGWRFWQVDEKIYWLQKKGAKRIELTPQIASLSSVWEFPPQRKSETNHPCSFPIELVNRCLCVCEKKDAIILDPYMGSGTVAISAKRKGFHYIGCEISKKYIEIANKRINEETAQISMF